jgi:signal peptidase I
MLWPTAAFARVRDGAAYRQWTVFERTLFLPPLCLRGLDDEAFGEMKLARLLIFIAVVIPLIVVGTYLWNPLNTPTSDPRGRILGVIPYRMPSESMRPTLPPGSLLVACTGAYLRSGPEVGDIVVFFPPPPEEKSPYVKRIVAVAGDAVHFDDGRFTRNGVTPREPFLAPGPDQAGVFESQVPAGFVFVAGDNRAHSLDSRHFGPIPISSIIGKVCAH